jgi:pilus assembly protein CpaC
VVELSVSKLRDLGFDFGDDVVGKLSGMAQSDSQPPNPEFAILNDAAKFKGVLEAMGRNNVARVLAAPTLVTADGRPTSFRSGNELVVEDGDEDRAIRKHVVTLGTDVEITPTMLDDRKIEIDLKLKHAEADPNNSVKFKGRTIPSLRRREVTTCIQVTSGQTAVLSGNSTNITKKIKLKDGSEHDIVEETKLLILISAERLRAGT